MEYLAITLAVLLLAAASIYVCVFKQKATDNNIKLMQIIIIWTLPLLVAMFIYSIIWLFSGSLEEDELVSSHDTGDFGIGSRLRYNH